MLNSICRGLNLAVLLLVVFNYTLSAQQTQNSSLRTITGYVSDQDQSLSGVNIIIEGTDRGTQTDSLGFYSIQARKGNILQFSHVGYNSVVVVVEDVTNELNLQLIRETNQLQEVIINAQVRDPLNQIGNIKEEEVLNVDLPMPSGRTINPYKSGFAIAYIPGKMVQNGLPLSLTLNGKVAGLRIVQNQIFVRDLPFQLIVDGMPTHILPDGEFVQDIFVFRNSKTIYIRTIANLTLQEQKRKQAEEKAKNQNYYQEDAVSTTSDFSYSSNPIGAKPKPTGPLKRIKGQITFADAPLSEVNVRVAGSDRGVMTNSRGRYHIQARQGEELIFSHVGFKAVSLIVEDVTSQLSFEMIPMTNELDEVIVKAKSTEGKLSTYTKRAQKEFQTSMGKYDPKKAGYSSGYIDGDQLNPASVNLLEFMAGKVAGLTVNPVTGEVVIRGGTGSISANTTPLWEVDGVVLTQMPQLDVANIKDIRVLKSVASLTRYGPQAAGGVIVISTRSGNFEPDAGPSGLNTDLANNNYYSNDAQLNTAALQARKTAEELRLQLSLENNPEKLKAIAYQLEALGLKFDVIEAYKKVFSLRPKYAQSFRDLAQAYVQAEKFKPAWRMYMGYFNQGFPANEEGIGEIVYDEMEWLYFRRQNQTQIRESFQTRSEDLIDFQTDVRFVFEWNTSEAEFDLEFVSPDRRSYIFEHKLEANQRLITEEKQIGYSSKRFFIEDIMEGDWLLNLTYKGNKKSDPTYFKLTAFYNWGKVNETKVVKVYKLTPDDRQKIQMLRINRQILLASR